MKSVTIVDYGLGNLYSVARAFHAIGAKPQLTREPAELAAAERVILPGVGAFGDGIRGLRERGLVEPLRAFARSGRPLLGLCLGMQLLLTESSEFGQNEGLGLIPGQVVPLAPTTNGAKIPHIGWNALLPGGGNWSGSILDGLSEGAQVYFVHSFVPVPTAPGDALANAFYGGTQFTAAVRRGNVAGCQFHPEKSGPTGLKILENFIR